MGQLQRQQVQPLDWLGLHPQGRRGGHHRLPDPHEDSLTQMQVQHSPIRIHLRRDRPAQPELRIAQTTNRPLGGFPGLTRLARSLSSSQGQQSCTTRGRKHFHEGKWSVERGHREGQRGLSVRDQRTHRVVARNERELEREHPLDPDREGDCGLALYRSHPGGAHQRTERQLLHRLPSQESEGAYEPNCQTTQYLIPQTCLGHEAGHDRAQA